MARWRGCWVFFFLLSAVLFSSCATLSPHNLPSDETRRAPSESMRDTASAGRSLERMGADELSAPVSASVAEKGDSEGEEPSQDGEGLTNQELIDSALEFCQASTEYWERGDLDNAVAALDEAYSLILQVKVDGDAELLQQKEDLRFTISKRIVEVYASRFTVAGGDHNAIPLVMNDHVRRELESFKGRERDFFMTAYSRSGRYRPAIVRALKEAGMPEELSWLPLIESGYKVRALSRARALGMWQFIASTGYRYGLKRDDWVDERMDPRKSTVAAIAYLQELHQMFGDWTTALAAYNCGETGVMNRIRTQRINYLDNFWDLYEKLPNETARYVPRLLAVLHIVKDPAAHDMELPPLEDELETEEITIHRQVLVKEVAVRLGVDPFTLQEMNAELRHDITPDGPYTFKAPTGMGESLLAMIDEIPTHVPPKYAYEGSAVVSHTVRSGDTLSGISRRYRIPVNSILRENGIKQNHVLRVGSKLRVPTRGAGSSAKVVQASAAKTASNVKPASYVVKRGDSLWQIASRFNSTAKEIQAFNGLKSTQLSTGQVLMIPPGSQGAGAGPKKTYTVQGGDNPYLIAKKHEMELSDFLELNNLTTECTIFPGQNLAIRGD
jgi:membrane-bound lytic murein transglycosylase D